MAAANQGRSYSKVVFPPGSAPKSANKGCGWLLSGGVSQEAGYTIEHFLLPWLMFVGLEVMSSYDGLRTRHVLASFPGPDSLLYSVKT